MKYLIDRESRSTILRLGGFLQSRLDGCSRSIQRAWHVRRNGEQHRFQQHLDVVNISNKVGVECADRCAAVLGNADPPPPSKCFTASRIGASLMP
ncbi:MAG: hypothetical protein ABIR61_00840 [Casimicrobiaceae bacterium]